MRLKTCCPSLAWMLISALWSVQAIAAPPTTGAAATSPVATEVLETKIKETQVSTSLDEATKTKLTELYRKALTHLETARSQIVTAEAFVKSKQTAVAEAQKLQKELEKAPKAEPTARDLGVSDDTPLSQLEQVLSKEKADLAALEAKVSDLEKQLEQEATRPDTVRLRVTEAKKIQDQVDSDLKVPPPDNELPALTEARRWALETQRSAVSAEIHALDEELLSRPMRIELLKAQSDRTARSARNVGLRVRLLETLVGERRQAEVERAQVEAAVAQLEAAGKHPLIGQLAQENAALGQELSRVASELANTSAEEEAIKGRAKQIEADFRRAKQRLEIAGLTESLGRLLLQMRRQLPDVELFRSELAARQGAIAQASLRQVQHSEARKRLRDLEAAVQETITPLTSEEQTQIRDEVRELLRNRRALLNKAVDADAAYLRALGELDFVQRRLVEAGEEYDAFLGQHLLWTPSAPAVSLSTLFDVPDAVRWLLSPLHWTEVGQTLLYDATNLIAVVLAVVFAGTLVWKRRRIRAALQRTGEKVGKPTSDRLSYTLQGLALTVLLAAPWPLLMAVVAWRLQVSPEGGEFVKAIGAGLGVVAPALFNLRLFLMFCAPGGVAAVHFRWQEKNLRLFRRGLYLLIVILLPTAFVAAALDGQSNPAYWHSLGRVAFVVMMVTLAMVFRRLFDPQRGVLADPPGQKTKSSRRGLRYLWYGLAVGVPAVLVVLALAGYMYTAQELVRSSVSTLWLILALVVLHDLAVRWLTITRRRLALQAAREQREAERAALEAEKAAHTQGEQGAAEASGIPVQVDEEPEMDLVELDIQSRKLLNTALVHSAAVDCG